MLVAVPKETTPGERRVALVPEVVKRLSGHGVEVLVESGAGEAAMIPDSLTSKPARRSATAQRSGPRR